MPNPLLEVQDIAKEYGETKALKGVSLEVSEGEVFGLLGPNGAGKTTLLSIISCLLDPTHGEVRLGGRSVKRSDRNIRRSIGIVPQELALYQELTARENLRFIGELYGIQDTVLKTRIGDILELIGLKDRADQAARTFSGGMKRRLNLGLALVHQPKLLLLDEPTTGVDPQSRNHLFEGVKRLSSQGLTIIYTSHYMEEVQALCSRIGIIDHGELIACDTLQGLLELIPGRIRFRISERPPNLLQELNSLVNRLQSQSREEHIQVEQTGVATLPFLTQPPEPDQGREEATVSESSDGLLQIQAADVSAATVQLISLLRNLNIELTSLEVEQPNLERVFLHLTGQRLRD